MLDIYTQTKIHGENRTEETNFGCSARKSAEVAVAPPRKPPDEDDPSVDDPLDGAQQERDVEHHDDCKERDVESEGEHELEQDRERESGDVEHQNDCNERDVDSEGEHELEQNRERESGLRVENLHD